MKKWVLLILCIVMMLSLLAGMSAAAHADSSTTDDYMAWISDAVCTYHDDPVGYEETIFFDDNGHFLVCRGFPPHKAYEQPHQYDENGYCTVCNYEGMFYTVNIADGIINGTVEADVTRTVQYETVTLTVEPDAGYELDTLTVKQGETVVETAAGENGTYTFTLPAGDVTVSATFKEISYGEPDFTLPAMLTGIEEAAFEGAAMTVVYIPDGCTSIGASAFKDCADLVQIRLPKDCVIDDTAFAGCEGLEIFAPAGGTTEDWCAVNNIRFFAEAAK